MMVEELKHLFFVKFYMHFKPPSLVYAPHSCDYDSPLTDMPYACFSACVYIIVSTSLKYRFGTYAHKNIEIYGEQEEKL